MKNVRYQIMRCVNFDQSSVKNKEAMKSIKQLWKIKILIDY